MSPLDPMRALLALIALVSALVGLVPHVNGQQYLYSWRPSVVADPLVTSDGRPPFISSVSNVDDAPFQRIQLPFVFPFFGVPHKAVSISPNGGLHFNPNEPCCVQSGGFRRCVFSIPTGNFSCGLNSAYFNVIAACITDFNPGAKHYTLVSWGNNRNSTIFRWHDISLYTGVNPPEALPDFSFTATLFKSGRIVVKYFRMTDPSKIGYWGPANTPRTWMVGLRQEQGRNPSITNGADYNLTTNGTYPPSWAIRSPSTLTYCLLGEHFCVWPSVGNPLGGGFVRISSPHTDCFELNATAFTCLFGDAPSPSAPIYDTTTGSLLCEYPPGQPGTVQVRLKYTTGLSRVDNGKFVVHALNVPQDPRTLVLSTFEYVAGATPPSVDFENFCQTCNEGINHATLRELVRPFPVFAPDFCVLDCTNQWLGKATVDECGQCCAGKSGRVCNGAKDCAGECFGPAKEVNGSCVCVGDFCQLPNQEQALSELSPGVDFVQVYQLLLAITICVFAAYQWYARYKVKHSLFRRVVPQSRVDRSSSVQLNAKLLSSDGRDNESGDELDSEVSESIRSPIMSLGGLDELEEENDGATQRADGSGQDDLDPLHNESGMSAAMPLRRGRGRHIVGVGGYLLLRRRPNTAGAHDDSDDEPPLVFLPRVEQQPR